MTYAVSKRRWNEIFKKYLNILNFYLLQDSNIVSTEFILTFIILPGISSQIPLIKNRSLKQPIWLLFFRLKLSLDFNNPSPTKPDILAGFFKKPLIVENKGRDA